MATRSRQTWKLDAQGNTPARSAGNKTLKVSESNTSSAWGPICRKPNVGNNGFENFGNGLKPLRVSGRLFGMISPLSVYGEFLLFEQTVKGLRWAWDRRHRIPDCKEDAPLFLNGRGERFDKPTQSGNRNQQIPNQFARLLGRIRDAGLEMPALSFGKLRNSAADLIRRFSDGEVSGVFLCHGQPVRTDNLADVYTNRPFGKVFATLRKVEEHLKEVFEAAGADPFPR